MAKEMIFNGETIRGTLIKGRAYKVQNEYDGFVWLCNEIGTATRVLSEVCTDVTEETEKFFEFGKPKPQMEIPKEVIDQTIAMTEIYRRARAALNDAQREQVGYGIQKYPEPLNADTWTILETIRHIKGELIDGIHYLTMLEIKFESMGEKDFQK